MVRFLRNNANNANGVDGAIYEATIGKRMLTGEIPALGILQRISADGLPNANTVDTLSSQFAIQVKSKRDVGAHFVPSDLGNASQTSSEYLDTLAAQANLFTRQPCLVTNRPINPTLQDMLSSRGITWIQVVE